MGGSIRDWKILYREIFKHLKPGAWVEIHKYETWIRSDDDTINNASSLTEWQIKVNEASKMFGKTLDVAQDHKQSMIDAGFVDVVDAIYKVISLGLTLLVHPSLQD